MKRLTPISQAIHRWRGSVTAAAMARAFFLLLFAFLAPTEISQAAKYLQPSNIPAAPAVRSTLDDFDGDFRPDQIAVWTGNNEFSGTQYWIDVRLSSAGRQLIPVFSLPGGIQVVARDVNGNGSLDLVLTTTWLRLPVAVLLNDGHGRFTRAEPDAFPAAFQDAGTNWQSRARCLGDCTGLLRSWRSLLVLAPGSAPGTPSLAGRIAPSNRKLFVSLTPVRHSGRAPPSAMLL